jgi:hypothetical protein
MILSTINSELMTPNRSKRLFAWLYDLVQFWDDARLMTCLYFRDLCDTLIFARFLHFISVFWLLSSQLRPCPSRVSQKIYANLSCGFFCRSRDEIMIWTSDCILNAQSESRSRTTIIGIWMKWTSFIDRALQVSDRHESITCVDRRTVI